jgi:hypothetical protein
MRQNYHILNIYCHYDASPDSVAQNTAWWVQIPLEARICLHSSESYVRVEPLLWSAPSSMRTYAMLRNIYVFENSMCLEKNV